MAKEAIRAGLTERSRTTALGQRQPQERRREGRVGEGAVPSDAGRFTTVVGEMRASRAKRDGSRGSAGHRATSESGAALRQVIGRWASARTASSKASGNERRRVRSAPLVTGATSRGRARSGAAARLVKRPPSRDDRKGRNRGNVKRLACLTPPGDNRIATGARGRRLRFASCDGVYAIDRPIERHDDADAGHFGLRNEVCLGEVEPVEFVDLKRSE